MGSGADIQGYRQISKTVAAVLIGPSTGSTDYTSGTWQSVEVVSSKACFAGITAGGLAGSSKITSGTSFSQGAVIRCSLITAIKLSSGSTGHMVIAHNKVLY
jgi:predicted Abi (CAAX) family protease